MAVPLAEVQNRLRARIDANNVQAVDYLSNRWTSFKVFMASNRAYIVFLINTKQIFLVLRGSRATKLRLSKKLVVKLKLLFKIHRLVKLLVLF
jgi:hypothetical protein